MPGNNFEKETAYTQDSLFGTPEETTNKPFEFAPVTPLDQQNTEPNDGDDPDGYYELWQKVANM